MSWVATGRLGQQTQRSLRPTGRSLTIGEHSEVLCPPGQSPVGAKFPGCFGKFARVIGSHAHGFSDTGEPRGTGSCRAGVAQCQLRILVEKLTRGYEMPGHLCRVSRRK